ncbi:MAG TPA: cellulose-binding domain-containing protein, partial [Phytomonospora sp.]
MRSPHIRRARLSLLAVLIVAVAVAGLLSRVPAAGAAAPGCRADYRVASQWDGGFTAEVTVANLGDPVNGWSLTWTFPSGQRVTQAWNATVVQNGTAATAAGVDWNRSIPTGGAVSFGFNASWSGQNAVPAAFALNGVTCTGGTVPTPTPTTPPGDAWNPPAALAPGLTEVWNHVESTYPNLYGFRNYGWDQLFANGGAINYCVRWDSPAAVSAALRDRIHAALTRQFTKWTDALRGWSDWPYPTVPVKVVGWAVRDRAQLQWTDDSVDVYVNDINENAPQCSAPCGRFFHQDGNYSGCPGGKAHHYDMSLWLTSGFGGGAGGDWGQRVGSEYFTGALGQEDI